MAATNAEPHIVAIEAIHCPIPTFDIPHTVSIYNWTDASQLDDRIKDATVIITTTIRISARELSPDITPRLKLIVAMAAGTDHVDKAAAKARGIPVCNCPGSNIESVSEHALGLYFATRRRLVSLNEATTTVPPQLADTEWKINGSLRKRLHMSDGKAPLSCHEETMGIIGYGALGKRISRMAQALGMKVLIAERKGSSSPRENRSPFEDVLKQSTVLVMCLPRNPETLNLISTAELRMMPSQALLINVARGGIVNEAALIVALKEGWISGAATDVFEKEPAGKADSPLLGPEAEGLNLVLTPHLAWYAQSTLENYQIGVKAIVEQWHAGRIINEVDC